jgi:hypothetical protein
MLTKKKLLKWANVGLLSATGLGTVWLWLLSSMSMGQRAVVTVPIVTGLLAALPRLRKEIADQVAQTDLPDDEPKEPQP